MNKDFDIQDYLTTSIEIIMRDVLKATMSDPRESAFMVRFAAASVKASKRRKQQEKEGLHVPAYLMASITATCNLHCAGCYSRANHATKDCAPRKQLTNEQWADIFKQAEELGISFIILLGGEPLLRKDVIEQAGKQKKILFPVFTNGTFIDESYLELFDKCRNLIPVISIEGDQEKTDARRGKGVYDKLLGGMEKLQRKRLLYGISITVTRENIGEVFSEKLVQSLIEKGCRAIFYIEYIPVSEGSEYLAPTDTEREIIEAGIARLRTGHPDTVFISFPGDEKSSGGCLAAGRGFFHINSQGGAEPCPVSAYSDVNVAETSLKEAIHSRLFCELRDGGYLLEEHAGGCVLHEKREQVEEIIKQNMEQYKRPGKCVIDISTWSRRSNFEFFRDFINPNLGVTARVDVRHAYCTAKANGVSFFLSYFYAILGAVNEIQEFRYRFDQEGNVVCYDRIDGLAPIRVEKKDNFAEMVFPFAEDFETFCKTARQVTALAASTDPYEQAEAMKDYNVILVSALPKLDFTSLCNTQRDRRGNDYPLCVIGKMGDDKTMPISITVHHGFADGEHISRFFELVQEKLNNF